MGPVSQTTGQQFGGAVMLHKLAARGLVSGAHGDHWVALASLRQRPAVEEPRGPVYPRKRRRVALLHLRSQRHQTSGVVAVKMRDHDVADLAQVDLQVAPIRQNGLGRAPVSTSNCRPSASTMAANPHSPIPSSASMVLRIVTLSCLT